MQFERESRRLEDRRDLRDKDTQNATDWIKVLTMVSMSETFYHCLFSTETMISVV